MKKSGFTIIELVLAIVAVSAIGLGVVKFFQHITPDGLTNQQIVEQTKYCNDNGLDVTQITNTYNYDVIKVICKGEL